MYAHGFGQTFKLFVQVMSLSAYILVLVLTFTLDASLPTPYTLDKNLLSVDHRYNL